MAIFHPRTAGVLAGLLFSLGCNPAGTNGNSAADEVNILLNNAGFARPVTITLSYPGYTSGQITIGSGAFISDEYPRATVGMDITISATAAAGGGFPAASGSIHCFPGPGIIGTSDYGQVDIGGSGSTITFNCNKTIGTWQ